MIFGSGPRVLITGASGLLGSNLLFLRPTSWNVVALTNRHSVRRMLAGVEIVQADLTRQRVEDVLKSIGPLDAIVQCIAHTNVDGCEQEPDHAKALNTDIATQIHAYAQDHGVHLVHISTDHVFDGLRGNYQETDEAHPLNIYAKTKLAAEKHILQSGIGKNVIIRTNFFGYNMQEKQDLAGWMYEALSKNKPISLFTDVIVSPLLVNALVSVIIEIVSKGLTGLLHIAASDACSKYAFGLMLANAFSFNTELITPVSIDDSDLQVLRPKNMSLNTDRAQSLLTTHLPTVQESLEWYRQLRIAGYQDAIRALCFPLTL